MALALNSPRQALSRAFLRQRVSRTEIDLFKANLIRLLDSAVDSKSEEFHKKLVSDFLEATYYRPSYFLNVKGNADLVIHNGEKPESSVGVIIEAKKPTNRAQMVDASSLDRKAFHELILYYLRERHGTAEPNLEVRHLAITNCHEWFVFDATDFEREFAQNKALVKQFHEFEAGRLAGTTTDFFYTEIASRAVRALQNDIKCTYFNFRDYEAAARNATPADDSILVELYKLLSPQHLLKLPFPNESNTLHRGFYTELLHVIGLAESKDGAKRIIGRKPVGKRNPGSLIENAIVQLESLGKMSRIPNLDRFGADKDERVFGVALELVLTWINRVLFLKLLEAQIKSFKRTKDAAFLNVETVPDFDTLNSLFFQVLAKETSERLPDVVANFGDVPYLNSSLFEPTELEQIGVFVSNLQDGKRLPIISGTVLKDASGKNRTGEISALEYIFAFLDAYDFASDSAGDIAEESKALISASVLGLIFEKINGYKDGSFFTPGAVTMHMSRELVRDAIISRFNSTKAWDCKSFADLYNKIDDPAEANEIVNSIRICDPAVGSGHFLVSVLNELIVAKAELRLLRDQSGMRLKEYSFEVANDELVITDEDGHFFAYNPKLAESQRVQESVFHEKRSIIEGCLFGVDINSNSVNICRLRLWIELLKSAFYKGDGELETLPNIDINIKSGNSLISRFALDADLRPALRKHSIKIKQYRASVLKYQNARSKAEKADMQAFIDKLKGNFRTEIFDNDPKVRQLRTLQAELATLQNQTLLFGETSAMKRARVAREKQLKADIKRLEASIDEIKGNTMFRDAFEWRFEFPEVLDEDGVFVGFDAVIGNPPYGVRTPELTREYVGLTVGRVPDYEIYYWFLNRASQILRPKGILSYIIPNSFLFNVGARNYRLEFVSRWDVIDVLDCTDFPLFPDAVVRNVILSARKVENAAGIFYRPTEAAKSFGDLASRPTRFVSAAVLAENNTNWGLLFKLDQAVLDLVARLRQYPKLESAFEATQGFIPYRLKDLTARLGAVEAKSIVKDRKWHSNRQEGPDYVEEIFGRSLSKYGYSRSGKFVKYGPHVATYVEPRFFNQSRLLVREITNPTIIATLVEEMFVNDPQIIAVISRQDSMYPLRLLWAILNSKLAVFYHFNGSPKATKGLFPKVLVGDVKQFPLPRTIDQVKFQRLETLVGQAFQQATSGAALDAVETAIDDAVMDLYDLSNSEIELVRAFQLPSRTADGEPDSVVA